MKKGKTPISSKVVAAIHLPPVPDRAAANGDDMGTIMVFLEDGRCYEVQEIDKHLFSECQWEEGFTVPATPAWHREQALPEGSALGDAHLEE